MGLIFPRKKRRNVAPVPLFMSNASSHAPSSLTLFAFSFSPPAPDAGAGIEFKGMTPPLL